jgi:hypothetical protein
MSIAGIERTKLTANFFNAVASGIILAALVAPFIGMGLGTIPNGGLANVIGLSILGLVLSIVLHLVARRVLLGLEA